MYLVFNPSGLALVLSAVSVAALARRSSSASNYAHQKAGGKLLTAGVPFYGHENVDNEKTTAQRRAEKIFPLNSNAQAQRRGDSNGSNSHPDVGILLHGGRLHRFQTGAHWDNNSRHILQRSNTNSAEAYALCGSTCKPSACNCVYNFWSSVEECTSEIDTICNGVTDADGTEWSIQGCIPDYPQYPGYQEYFMNLFCPFSNCVVDGGTLGSCRCQMFKTNCEKFGDEHLYMVRHYYEDFGIVL